MPVASNGPEIGSRTGQAIEGGPDCPVRVVIVAFPRVESGCRVLWGSTEREGSTRGDHDGC